MIHELRSVSRKNQMTILIVITIILYLFCFQFNETVDFQNCRLCDAKEYKKVYDYFKSGTEQQIAFPFYTRPLVPFLASLIPVDDVEIGFHIVNFIFILLSVFVINALWDYLKVKPWIKLSGFAWLLTHWTGLIRYNLFDHLTVDVPVYFVQALALILFFKRKLKWFYLLTPLALLQKESFLAVAIVLLVVHIWFARSSWFEEGKHLLFSIIVGLIIQKVILAFMPEQLDQRNSIMAILYHGKWALDDPTRFIRWFAALGSAFGLLPFLILFKLKSFQIQNREKFTLLILSIMYCCFGLLAGEDMTRILFLGFPFIITLSLLFFQNESKWLLITALVLSIPSLHLFPFPINNHWGVDYAPLDFVYSWAAYYSIAALLFLGVFAYLSKKQESL